MARLSKKSSGSSPEEFPEVTKVSRISSSRSRSRNVASSPSPKREKSKSPSRTSGRSKNRITARKSSPSPTKSSKLGSIPEKSSTAKPSKRSKSPVARSRAESTLQKIIEPSSTVISNVKEKILLSPARKFSPIIQRILTPLTSDSKFTRNRDKSGEGLLSTKNILCWYQKIYTLAMLSAWTYVLYIFLHKFFTENLHIIFASPKTWHILLEESFYKGLIHSSHSYFEPLGRPFFAVLGFNSLMEIFHCVFQWNRKFPNHKSAICESCIYIVRYAIMSIVLLLYPVKSVCNSLATLMLMLAICFERKINLLHRLYNLLFPKIPRWISFLRYNSYRILSPMGSLAWTFVMYEYMTNHPSMTTLRKFLTLLYMIASLRYSMILHSKYMNEGK